MKRLRAAGWTVALTDAEIMALYEGMPPFLVCPSDLMFYELEDDVNQVEPEVT